MIRYCAINQFLYLYEFLFQLVVLYLTLKFPDIQQIDQE